MFVEKVVLNASPLILLCNSELAFILPPIGTGTLLILAKEHGLIQSVEQSLRKLQDLGLWISEPVIQLLKSKAGE